MSIECSWQNNRRVHQASTQFKSMGARTMKRFFSFTLLLALLLSIFSLSHAGTVQVGSLDNDSAALPIRAIYSYSYCQQIYTQTRINFAGPITKIRFYYVEGDITNSEDWRIFMGHTSKTSFNNNSDWIALSTLTQVFDGDVGAVPASAGWMDITLNTPFVYNNVDNLVIAVYQYTPDFTPSGMKWGSFYSETNTSIAYYHDSVNPNPASPPLARYRDNKNNCIQLVFSEPMTPVLVYPGNNGKVTNDQVLMWALPEGSAPATGYDVYIDDILVGDNIPTDFYPLTGLAMGWHSFYVRANNEIGSSALSDIRSFEIVDGIAIGTSQTTSTVLPFNAYWGFSRSLAVYHQDQIGEAGSIINSIGWCVSEASSTSIPYKIYGMRTADNVVAPMQWDDFTSQATLLKEGSHVFNSVGWNIIDLDVPFQILESNLIIGVETYYGGDGASSYPTFLYTQCDNSYCRYWISDDVPPSGTGVPNGLRSNMLLWHTHIVPTFPFVESFETNQADNTLVKGWRQVLDGNKKQYWMANSSQTNANRTPRNGSFNATLRYNGDAWLMKPFYMEAGNYYDINVWARQDGNDPDDASIGIYYGYAGTIEEGTVLALVPQTGLVDGDYQRIHARMYAPYTCVYFIAIRGIINWVPWYISIDDITVQKQELHSSTAGTGTSANDRYSYPAVYGGWYKNAREQYIIPAAEMISLGHTAAMIEHIGFQVEALNGCGELPNFTIRMGYSDAAEFVDNKFLTGLMEVYCASSYVPSVGYNYHKFHTPFYWDGVSNIVVEVSFDMQDSFSSNASTRYTNTGPTCRAMYYRSDNVAWDTVNSGTLSTQRPNITMFITDPLPGPIAAPILMAPADNAVNVPQAGFKLTWQPDLYQGSLPSSYVVYLSSSEASIFTEHSWTTTNLYFNPVTDGGMNLNYSQRYYWTVKAVRGAEEKVVMPPCSFVIEPSVIDSYPWVEYFDSVAVGEMPVGWTVIASHSGSNYRGWSVDTMADASSGTRVALVYHHPTYPKDEWMITPPLLMQEGESYTISFKVKGLGWGGVGEALALRWGTAPTVESMNSNPPLYDNDQVSFGDWMEIRGYFTPSSTGVYYFGWHAYSQVDLNYIAVDDIAIYLTHVLTAPVVSVSISGSNVVLSWDPVPGANYYYIYASEDPYNFGSTPIAGTDNNQFVVPANLAKRFFRVTSIDVPYKSFGENDMPRKSSTGIDNSDERKVILEKSSKIKRP